MPNFSDIFSMTPNTDKLREFIREGLDNDHCLDYYVSDSSPITLEEFAELLPDELIDPDGNKVFISQSLIKGFKEVQERKTCPKKFSYQSLQRNYTDANPQSAMAKGCRFEYLLTGNLPKSGKVPPEITTEAGNVSKAENQRIRDNVLNAKETLSRNRFFLNMAKKGEKYYFKCLSIDMDLEWDDKIGDIKYSGLLGKSGKDSEFGWNYQFTKGGTNEIRIINYSDGYGHKVQAIHYPLVIELLTGIRKDFYFMVFDNRAKKEGEYEIIKMEPSEETRYQHMHIILNTIKGIQAEWEGDNFEAIPNYAECKSCPLVDCPERSKSQEIKTFKF